MFGISLFSPLCARSTDLNNASSVLHPTFIAEIFDLSKIYIYMPMHINREIIIGGRLNLCYFPLFNACNCKKIMHRMISK